MVNENWLYIKKLLYGLCISSSLLAMQPEITDNMMVFLGEGKPLIPLARVKSFEGLTRYLMEKGSVSQEDGLLVYGTNDDVFPQEEKNALWVLDNVTQAFKRTDQPLSSHDTSLTYYPQVHEEEKLQPITLKKLWDIARYTHQWQECEPKAIGEQVVYSLINKETIYFHFPELCIQTPGRISNSANKRYVWKDYKDLAKGYYALALFNGALMWHNHVPDLYWCHCCLRPENRILGSYAQRYCMENHSLNDDAFTPEDFVQFMKSKAIKNVSLHNDKKILKVAFVDGTRTLFERDAARSSFLYEEPKENWPQDLAPEPVWKHVIS